MTRQLTKTAPTRRRARNRTLKVKAGRPAGQVQEKYCPGCDGTLPASDFGKNRARHDGLQSHCKACQKPVSKERYESCGPEMREQISATHRARVAANRKKLMAYLTGRRCTDCPETDPIVLDFDHRPGCKKRYNISDMVNRGWGWAAIEKEIGKCEIVCANDHRRRESIRGNHWKTRALSA